MNWCRFGFHDKTIVETLNACNFIELKMNLWNNSTGKVPNNLIDDIYHRIYFWNGKEFKDKVCLNCGKCFTEIDSGKKKIDEEIRKYNNEKELEAKRLKFAKRIFDQSCIND